MRVREHALRRVASFSHQPQRVPAVSRWNVAHELYNDHIRSAPIRRKYKTSKITRFSRQHTRQLMSHDH